MRRKIFSMLSRGTHSSISLDDAVDELQRLMTKSAKVQGVFSSEAGGAFALVVGVIRSAPHETFRIHEADRMNWIVFDPARFASRTYCDKRSMLREVETLFGAHFCRVLAFAAEDGSNLTIYEFAEPHDGICQTARPVSCAQGSMTDAVSRLRLDRGQFGRKAPIARS